MEKGSARLGIVYPAKAVNPAFVNAVLEIVTLRLTTRFNDDLSSDSSEKINAMIENLKGISFYVPR
jgi:hypothetical protein